MDVVPRPVRTATGPPTIASLWAEVSGREMTDADLEWPPDVFALVGTVLGRTHAYRFAVSPPAGRHWPPRGADSWNGTVCGTAEQLGSLGRGARGPAAARWWPTRGRCSATGRRRRWRTIADGLRLAGVRGAADAARRQRRDLRRCRRRARPDARVRLPVPRPGRRAAGAHRARCPASPPTACGCCRRCRTPPGGISLPLAVALPLPARSGRSTSPGTRCRPGGRALGQQQANVLLMPWPLRVRQRDFRPLSGRSAGRRTSRSASSSSPPPRPSTSTWSSARCGAPSTRSTASTR